MKRLIEAKRSVIVACDVPPDEVKGLVEATWRVDGIGGYKIGFRISSGALGLQTMVSHIHDITGSSKPVIYDHQKGGTDIPDLGPGFAEMLVWADVDAVILFPFGGSKTQMEWTKACQEVGLTVLIGGHMTQEGFLASEGGYITDDAPQRIYIRATEQGVRDFVVPGNKVELVEKYRKLLEGILGVGNFTLYAPGFIKQGGVISETAKVAGPNWHAIVGSAICNAEDPGAAAKKMTSQILGEI